MDSELFSLDTQGRQFLDLTEAVASFCSQRGDGLVSIFVPHATAGLAIFETGAGTEPDLGEAIARLFPKDDRWQHRHGTIGHGADHVLPAFVSPSVTIPVLAGRLALGTWQSVVFVDPNTDNNRRQYRLSFLNG